jgi:hypothetical protein
MKKCSFILLLAAPLLLNAQHHFQAGVYSGYTLPAVLKVNMGRYRTEASMNYGVTISMSAPDLKGVASRVHLEMQYNHQGSELRYKKYSTDSVYNIGKVDVNTVLMGATTEFTSTQVKPYAGILAGVTFLNGSDAFPGIARFTMSLVGGAKVALTSYAGDLQQCGCGMGANKWHNQRHCTERRGDVRELFRRHLFPVQVKIFINYVGVVIEQRTASTKGRPRISIRGPFV